jgi:hypothetical protein
LFGLVSLLLISSVQAVEVSAAVQGATGQTNHIGLPVLAQVFDPGTADFGTPGLAAPGSGSSSNLTSFAYPSNAPNVGNAVQMYGDAVSKITNLGSGSFQADVTLTNFWINQGTPLPTNEYIYLNVWETFTNLGLPSSLTWSTTGTISVLGSWMAGPSQFLSIEPIAIAYDPGKVSWTNVSPFFGSPHSGPGSGTLFGSAGVSSLTANVSSGQLLLGMQTILLLNDPVGFGGAQMHLPSSLHLSVTLTPVPVPEPSGLALGVLGLAACAGCYWRRRRRAS